MRIQCSLIILMFWTAGAGAQSPAAADPTPSAGPGAGPSAGPDGVTDTAPGAEAGASAPAPAPAPGPSVQAAPAPESPPAGVPAAPPPAEPRPAATPSSPAHVARPFPAVPPPGRGAPPDAPRFRHRDHDAEGSGQFNLGVGRFNLDELNDALANAGYDRLDETVTVLGGEGHAVLRSGFMLGGRGAALLGDSVAGPDDVRAELNGGYGMFEAGWAAVHQRHLLIAMLGGIGGYGYALELSEQRQARFDEVLADPRRSSTLATGGVLVGLTFAVDARVPIGAPDGGNQGFFSIGLRLGGLYGPSMGDWSLSDDSRVTASPNQGLRGVTAALAVGFGGYPTAPYVRRTGR